MATRSDNPGAVQGEHIVPLPLCDLDAITSTLSGDVEQIRSCRKGKGREDSEPDDEELALRMFEEELQTLSVFLRDYYLARSIAASDTDEPLLENITSANDHTQDDSNLSRSLLGRGSILRPQGSTSASASSQLPIAESSSCVGSSDFINGTTYERPPSGSECVICYEDASGLAGLLFPCGDAYDINCAVELFLHARRDESLMPPRCCQVKIPTDQVFPYLQQREQQQFLEKLREHETRDRLYCPRATCSKFMGSSEGEVRTLTCPDCDTRVCTGCKKVAHPPHILCETDTESQQLLTLGQDQGWKRCPGCHQMIELSVGCYHITCLCRTEFCYLCLALWKNCECIQWDEQHLYMAAVQRVQHDNSNRAVPLPANERVRQVNAAANILREHHACTDHDWYLRQGRAQCENCSHVLAKYLLCCRRCQFRACVRCARNRL